MGRIGGIPESLLAGYQRFRAERYPDQSALYRDLAAGQKPGLMVIACADSRVDPATIFSAAPGELFVVRNVANLVPASDGRGSRELSAAIAFAVGQLKVADVVVLGHGDCGGIAACVAMERNVAATPDGVAEWVREALPALADVDRALPSANPHARQRALEHMSINRSLANLAGYPPVADAIADLNLRLHGAWFSIGEGRLEWLDQDSGNFGTVPAQAV